MHSMKHDSKTLTSIGLIIEGLFVLMSFMITLFVVLMPSLILDSMISTNLPPYTHDELLIFSFIRFVFGLITLTGFILFLINLIVFTKLLKGNLHPSKAEALYTYQFIIGIIYLFANSIVGVLYLISALFGKRTLNEEKIQ